MFVSSANNEDQVLDLISQNMQSNLDLNSNISEMSCQKKLEIAFSSLSRMQIYISLTYYPVVGEITN